MQVDHRAARIRGAAAIGVLDVDAGARQPARHGGQRAGLVAEVDREHRGRHRQHAAVAEQVQRLAWVAHHQPDDGMVGQGGDGEGADADPVAGQVGGHLCQDPRLVLEEHRQLRLNAHRRHPLRFGSRNASALQVGLAPERAEGYTGTSACEKSGT